MIHTQLSYITTQRHIQVGDDGTQLCPVLHKLNEYFYLNSAFQVHPNKIFMYFICNVIGV